MRLRTPTAFRLPGSDGPRRVIPLPVPELVFGSLAQRLVCFAGSAAVPAEVLEVVEGHLILADAQLHTARHLTKAPDIREIGCVGEVTYAAVGAAAVRPAALRGVTALVRFAAYAGVGDQTPKGMGDALPLDQPVGPAGPAGRA